MKEMFFVASTISPMTPSFGAITGVSNVNASGTTPEFKRPLLVTKTKSLACRSGLTSEIRYAFVVADDIWMVRPGLPLLELNFACDSFADRSRGVKSTFRKPNFLSRSHSSDYQKFRSAYR